MNQPTITFVINGETYKLRASDAEGVRKMPKEVRQQLIALLEAVKREEQRSEAVVQQAIAKAKVGARAEKSSLATGRTPGDKTANPERLGKGDVDNLMARLILEEKQNQKPGLTKQTIYKWTGGILVAIVLLVLIF